MPALARLLAHATPKQDRTKQQLHSIAKEIADHYQSLRFVNMHFTQASLSFSYDQLPASTRQYFEKAAHTCQQLNATARDYVVAQFDAFARFGKLRKIRVPLMPQPNQLFGLNAAVRYGEYTERKNQDQHRDHYAKPTQLKRHQREERKLAAMARRLRRPESEVLAALPSEFTVDFLQHRGVWQHVQALYRQQMATG